MHTFDAFLWIIENLLGLGCEVNPFEDLTMNAVVYLSFLQSVLDWASERQYWWVSIGPDLRVGT